jgi:hypothetical protein
MPKTFLKKLSGAWAWLPGLGIGYGIYKWVRERKEKKCFLL